MKSGTRLALAGITVAVACVAPACSSSSGSTSTVDSGSAVDSAGALDSAVAGDTGAAADTGAAGDGTTGDTGSSKDSAADAGSPTDAGHSDAIDAPYCGAVQTLLDAGSLSPSNAACFDQCCSELTTCVQSTACSTVFACVTQCTSTTDGGAATCLPPCEADASSTTVSDVSQLAMCLAHAGCK